MKDKTIPEKKSIPEITQLTYIAFNCLLFLFFQGYFLKAVVVNIETENNTL